jgi:hypothetical protein
MKRIPLSLYLVLLFTRGLNLVQISGFKKNKESTGKLHQIKSYILAFVCFVTRTEPVKNL